MNGYDIGSGAGDFRGIVAAVCNLNSHIRAMRSARRRFAALALTTGLAGCAATEAASICARPEVMDLAARQNFSSKSAEVIEYIVRHGYTGIPTAIFVDVEAWKNTVHPVYDVVTAMQCALFDQAADEDGLSRARSREDSDMFTEEFEFDAYRPLGVDHHANLDCGW